MLCSHRFQAFRSVLAFGTLGLSALPALVHAQALSAPYSADYTLKNLGSAPGVPESYGGLTLEAGNPNVLLLGGDANIGAGGIYAVKVARGSGNHITGFSGNASLFASAPFIDGGLAYGPGGVLFYTTYPTNQVGEIKPGSASPDKIVDLSALGVSPSVGSLDFVPAGFGGAGGFKLLSFDAGGQYSATLTPDGSGTYDISSVTLQSQPNLQPEGMAYIANGNPDFSANSALVTESGGNSVWAYQVDANGNLIVGTRQNFITGLVGGEGALIDPITGDFLFITYGSNSHIIEVQGFSPPAPLSVPEPGSIALLVGMSLSGAAFLRRRKQTRKTI